MEETVLTPETLEAQETSQEDDLRGWEWGFLENPKVVVDLKIP